MHSLAVRVSSIKNSDNLKKNSEIRASILCLPATETFSIHHKAGADVDLIIENFKKQFSEAPGVDQQLTAVKNIITEAQKSDLPIDKFGHYSQILSDLYFYAPLKHPIRNTVVKVLHKTTDQKRATIIKCVLHTITNAHLTIKKQLTSEVSMTSLNDFVVSLIGCFENFPEAVLAIESCFLSVMPTLNRIIRHYLSILGENTQLSPAKRSEIYIFLHNAIRITLSCVQQYQMQINSREILDDILRQCWYDLMENNEYFDLPMDTKVNCGILKVYYDRIFDDVYLPKEDIFKSLSVDKMPDNVKLLKQLCYSVAVINTITDKDLTNKNFFITMNTIVLRLTSIGKEHTMDSSLLMAVTRALVQMSKKLLVILRKNTLEKSSDLEIQALKSIASDCLSYVWIGVDHSLDCVRYLAKDLLKNLLKLGQEHEEYLGDLLVKEPFVIAQSKESNEQFVCLLLDYLGQVFSTERVLTDINGIQKKMLENIFKDNCWPSCYERLMLKSGMELDLKQWCELWIDPLLDVDESEWKDNFDRLKIIRNLYERALKSKPEAAEYILQRPNISLEIYLFVLWTMRRSGRKNYSPGNWKPSNDQKVLYAKIHQSDEMRILAFRILIECHKTSEQFPLSDLDEILDFFRYNCNCQNPSMRQQINTTMKKALMRIECAFSALKKMKDESSATHCIDYMNFIKNLINFCVDWCLFDGANFSRRTIGLTTLLHSVETWQKLAKDNREIYTKKLHQQLQKTLSDSYVSNKELANKILYLCVDYYSSTNDIYCKLNAVKELITSIRPDDSMTAAYYLEYCSFSGTHFKRYFDAIIWCETLLYEGLELAKQSLFKAARNNPLYGSILCIKHLLGQIDFRKVTSENELIEWRAFFKRIIPKCKELTDVVAPIVNSAAPEGHLPEDYLEYSRNAERNAENGTNEDSLENVKIMPQIILICAWRTVREASLLLGDISLNATVQSDTNDNGVITVEQLLEIGRHFQLLLAVTKHRGAFEQAYVGFSNLCIRMWRSNEPELHSCPMRWVQKIAYIISGEIDQHTDLSPMELDVTKLCFTRRSAGIPFMVQAIISSEIQVCSTEALNFCMNTFIEICKTSKKAESRTHSLNILRALFRCTELGEAVSEFISDAIECSIRGYNAVTWPERNSATLLFSALMTRTFGVQRSKQTENLNIRNKMTGRIFFIRYPRLYDFFLSELNYASSAIARNERPTQLHPLLLLISRLYPSALEGSESNLKLSTFIPLISSCSSSPQLVTRNLSAKSLVALIPPSHIPDTLFSILMELKVQNSKSSNHIHGYLLQILHLTRASKQHTHRIDNKILINFTRELLKFDLIELDNNNVTLKAYLDILIEIIVNCRLSEIDESLINLLLSTRDKFVEHMKNPNTYNRLTQAYIQKSFTILNLAVSAIVIKEFPHVAGDLDKHLSKITVSNTSNELLETQLNVLHLLILKTNKLEFNSDEYTSIEVDFVDFLLEYGNNNASTFLNLLPDSNDLYYILSQRELFYPFGTVKAFSILSIWMNHIESTDKIIMKEIPLIDLIKLLQSAATDSEIDDISNAVCKFINGYFKAQHLNLATVSSVEFMDILMCLKHISQAYKTSDLRLTAAEMTSTLHKYIFKQPIHINRLISFVSILLSLLRDDSVLVRNRASDIVLEIIGENTLEKVIPLVAEDRLLDWLDEMFVKLNPFNSWLLWKELIKAVEASDDHQTIDKSDQEAQNDGEVDFDIFEANNANMFGETTYVRHNCYTRLMRRVDEISDKSEEEKANIKKIINDEFSDLHNF